MEIILQVVWQVNLGNYVPIIPPVFSLPKHEKSIYIDYEVKKEEVFNKIHKVSFHRTKLATFDVSVSWYCEMDSVYTTIDYLFFTHDGIFERIVNEQELINYLDQINLRKKEELEMEVSNYLLRNWLFFLLEQF
ncbi:MAG: hypothetical protein JRJ76_09255 [Deltaproteobacteria bacterium]|nr:hypothetical protein [Deltaproteobacteria bacterium]MBW1846367.1 hypothetical protein [Deltaproteobacteria bacterium]MBW2179930.1 hypothetical protein [Deltaproteobacteria bacterium]MBW2364232.1 hypothetical protein [Deltaproteobacteria bacterium]